jgi:hypothetical protein
VLSEEVRDSGSYEKMVVIGVGMIPPALALVATAILGDYAALDINL